MPHPKVVQIRGLVTRPEVVIAVLLLALAGIGAWVSVGMAKSCEGRQAGECP